MMANEIAVCSGSIGVNAVIDYLNKNPGNAHGFWGESDFDGQRGFDVSEWSDDVGMTTVNPWKTIVDGVVAFPTTDRVWWMPLWGRAEAIGCFSAQDRDWVKAVSDELRLRIVGVEIIMSPTCHYEPTGVCSIAVQQQLTTGKAAVTWALANGYADRQGPTMPVITALTNNGSEDACHQGVGQTPGFFDRSDHGEAIAAFAW